MSTISKRILLAVFGLSLLIVFSAFAPAPTLGSRINFLKNNWSNIKSETNLSYENISSWLPDHGIRGKFEIAKSVLSLQTMEGITGESVFLSGPHGKEMDYNSNEFGHYNPAFLNKLHSMLEVLSKRKNFVTRGQEFYDQNFKNYLRTFYAAYYMTKETPSLVSGYQAAIASGDSPSMYLQEASREFAEAAEQEGYDVYEGFTCPGFWVRRNIDGTADEFLKLLELTLRTFDPSALG